MNDEILTIDINEYISDKVSTKIEFLKKGLEKERTRVRNQLVEIKHLEKNIADTDSLRDILSSARHTFSSIKSSAPVSGGWYDSQAKNRFKFFTSFMKNLFCIEAGYTNWLSSRGDGALKVYLGVNYYDNKNEIMRLVEILSLRSADINAFIKSFKMPYDYEKKDVISYVKNPHYCTNGAIFGPSQYWINRGAGNENMPHDLIQKNKYIVEPDVFSIVVETINKGRGKFIYLFAIPKYNDMISDEQITELGQCLIGMDNHNFTSDTIKDFVKTNMSKFNAETLDYLYGMTTKDNRYRPFCWENFPAKYQKKYIASMTVEDALKALTDNRCSLSSKEKTVLLREVLN